MKNKVFVYNPLGDVHNPSGNYWTRGKVFIDESDSIDPNNFDHLHDVHSYVIQSTFKPMTGQQYLLSLLQPKWNHIDQYNKNKERADKAYQLMYQVYEQEFGPDWLKKEIAQAGVLIHVATQRRVKSPNRGVYYMDTHEAIEGFFNELDQEKAKGGCSWIGTKQVTAEEFCLYSKGLFWMAGYNKTFVK